MVGGRQGELSADSTEDVLEAEMWETERALGGCPGSLVGGDGSPGVFLTCPNLGCIRSWVSHRVFSVILRVPQMNVSAIYKGQTQGVKAVLGVWGEEGAY